MLQKGLSNRPSGAVAFLIIVGSLALNLLRGENVLEEFLWGSHGLGISNLRCYAEQAACHLHKVFEEVVIGSPRDYDEGYEKKERKVAKAFYPDRLPQQRRVANFNAWNLRQAPSRVSKSATRL